MKKLIAAALVLGAATSTLAHADNSLNGFYLGGNLAYVSPSLTAEDTDCWYDCSAYTVRPTGADLGVQLGQNFSAGSLIYGWSANYNVGSQKETLTYGNIDTNSGSTSRMDYQGEFKSAFSLRARAGLQVNDTAIVVSFGPARGKFDSTFANSNGGVLSAEATLNGSVSGTVTGVSIEHNCSDHMTVALDVSSYSFKNKTNTMINANGTDSGSKVNFVNSVNMISLEANYKF